MTRFHGPSLLVPAALAALLAASHRTLAAQAEPPPPGRLVEVEGFRMHLRCVGSGAPTVVIEAGAGAWSLAWLHIQERIASVTRACVYDRAGLGWSEARPGAQTSERAARMLRALLRAAGEEPRFVLVGHSFGGYVVRVFADLYREEVAGVGLVESAHEDQWERLPAVVKKLLDLSMADVRARADAAARGTLSVDSIHPPAFIARDPYLDAAYKAEQLDPVHHRTYLGELMHMEVSQASVRKTEPLRGMPLVVLSSAIGFDQYRGSPIPVDESNRVWLELQDELAGLSDDVVHVVSRTAHHTLHYEEPDVVSGVIRELVSRIQNRPD